jgi:hypothetical protein
MNVDRFDNYNTLEIKETLESEEGWDCCICDEPAKKQLLIGREAEPYSSEPYPVCRYHENHPHDVFELHGENLGLYTKRSTGVWGQFVQGDR